VLSGQRLHGKFTLVRLKPRPTERGRQDNWLLIKGTMGMKARGRCRGFGSGHPGTGQTARSKALSIPGAVKARLPDKLAPQLASVRMLHRRRMAG